ncbi:MAG TPA: TAT-variant-translocated molybdopterin oxidoreductase, partial [Anaerolineae bacterium]
MNDEQAKRLDVGAIRARLASLQGRHFWQGLEELAETDDFKEFLEREFPREASVWAGGMSRRNFLKIMGASLALAGLAGCVNVPQGKIVPHVKSPDPNQVAGRPIYFSTAMTLGGYGMGLLVASSQGRPIKIEGNPDHPASLGATDTFAQASLLQLYDPDRSQVVTFNGEIRAFAQFAQAFAAALPAERANGGSGLRILTEPLSSPTLGAQLDGILAAFPGARWYQWEPAGADNALAGSQLAFGRAVQTVYHFAAANRILALDSDFLQAHPDTLRYARDFAGRRNGRLAPAQLNRLYAVESSPTLTGAKADHRLRLRAADVQIFAQALAARLGVAVPAPSALPAGVSGQWIDALVRDLQANQGSTLVIAGDGQPAAVHALAHAMNATLGNAGKTVTYTDPVLHHPVDLNASLKALVQDLNGGHVSTLLIIGANPVYSAPADIPFAAAMAKAGLRIHVGAYADETAVLAQWHIPESHYLEAWSDVRAFDGTAAIVQPLIEPLYDSHSAHELLALFTNPTPQNSYDLVRKYWQSQQKGGDFETWWQGALNKGMVPDSALPPVSPTVNVGQIASALGQASPAQSGALEIVFRPDPSIWDGRFANNGWLQELPKPLTKTTWDNAVLLSPATAERLGVQTNDLVELRYGGHSIRGPVFILPGHADDSATVHLGYGRPRAGRAGSGLGFNAYLLRTSAHPDFDQGLEIVKTGATYNLATTQFHWKME